MSKPHALALLGEEADSYITLAPRLRATSLTAIADIQELNRGGFDAVVLCSRDARSDDCRFAAAHGKHILLAAPLEAAAEAHTLMQECHTRHVRLMAGYLDRFLPSVAAIKQSLSSGQLGEPGLIRIHRWQSGSAHPIDASADIDLALWMFQSLPTEVYAIARRETDAGFAYVQIHLGFPAGGMGVIDVANTLPSNGSYFSLSLIGSTGAAYADDHHNQQLLFRDDNPVALKTGEGSAARLAQLQEFVAAIGEQREPSVTGADVRAALLVREAAGRSMATGRAARWTGDRYE